MEKQKGRYESPNIVLSEVHHWCT